MFLTQFQELFTFPNRNWATAPSVQWESLCSQMRAYEAPPRSMSLPKERKWELVSALQKSIRRADKPMALKVASAIDNMPEEYGYFWRRLCVTACEDIGPADDELVTFVVACSSIFTRKKTGPKTYDIFCFLVESLCNLSARSRIYCSMSMIESMVLEGNVPELSVEDGQIVSAILQQKATMLSPMIAWQEWQSRNDWRAEKMLRFVRFTLPYEMFRVQLPIPTYKMLFNLPSYSYDMYTRSGQEMLSRLMRGAFGATAIRNFIHGSKVKGALKALGEALFFAEGARLEGELLYPSLSRLEQLLVAHQHGLSLNEFLALQCLVLDALKIGIIDQIREVVLHKTYPCAEGTQPQGSTRQDLHGSDRAVNEPLFSTSLLNHGPSETAKTRKVEPAQSIAKTNSASCDNPEIQQELFEHVGQLEASKRGQEPNKDR
jgi:hypothetical protein